MDKPLKKVILCGPMRKRFGREFELAVSSTKEAIHALCIQVDGFKKYLFDSKSNGLEFAVFIGKRNINEDGLSDPVGSDEIRIAPVIQGSKRAGILQTIVGGALIALSFVPILAPVSSILLNMGVSMALGGVVQMLSAQPRGLGAKDSANNQPSYSMDGAVNTQAQGNPVPLCYGGPLIIGGAIISGGIYAEDIASNA
ncbi:tail component protein [Siphoviridae environmental samples]|nr:tail component protein [Siphoviridae environmental samples]